MTTSQLNDPRPTDGDPLPFDETADQPHQVKVAANRPRPVEETDPGDPRSLDLPNDGDLDAGDPPTGSEGTMDPDGGH